MQLPDPGTPWDAESLLIAMRESNRPGGVPDAVEQPALADAIARSIWTIDGTSWDTSSISGSCGPSTCIVDVAGAHAGWAGEDLWTLEVTFATGTVRPLVSDVRSLPPTLVADLDRMARSLADLGDPGALVLATARWLPPPGDGGWFVLSYRSGGEEGSCSREITIDAEQAEIVEEHATGC